MGMTIAEKILARASGRVSVEPGEILWAVPDLMIGHDMNYRRYREAMDKSGVKRLASPEKLLLTVDHEPYSDSPVAADNRERMRRDVRSEGIGHFFDLGRHGISHNVPVDTGLALPGSLIITSDTRSPALGCVGALAIALGAGFITVMATGKAWLRVPATLAVTLTGVQNKGVMSRDIAEWVANEIGPDLADYRVIEFDGPAVRALDIDGRHTLCNAMVDIGVKSAIVVPDEVTARYARTFGASFDPVFSDADAVFEDRLTFDISAIEPQVSVPPDPTNVRPISEVVGRKINQAYVGSCISGKLEDLRAAAQVMKGRKVHPDVRFIVCPATQKIHDQAVAEGLLSIFAEANCYVISGACGPCAGFVAPLSAGETCIGTGTRNESGRMGSSLATILIANAASVAASAVKGVVTDPREFLA